MNNAIVLLSGGLDSFVALDIAMKKYDNVKALFFDYGQKACAEELNAANEISKKYSIELINVKLPFLKEITKNSLVCENENNFDDLKSVWVANRNGLFVNIAASYCEALNYNYIIFGANKEEGRDFSDNQKGFIETVNACLEFSTLNHPKVIAPCVNMDKTDLVNYMIDNNLDFNLIKSCYQNIEKTNKKHCLNCMSCRLLHSAILNSKKPELIKEIF